MVQELIRRAREVRAQILKHYDDADIKKKQLVLNAVTLVEKEMGIEFWVEAPVDVHIMGIEMFLETTKEVEYK